MTCCEPKSAYNHVLFQVYTSKITLKNLRAIKDYNIYK